MCKAISEHTSAKICHVSSGVIATVVVLSAITCIIALGIILDNHLTKSVSGIYENGLPVLKQNVVDICWATAKWSGIIAASGAGLFIINGCSWIFIGESARKI